MALRRPINTTPIGIRGGLLRGPTSKASIGGTGDAGLFGGSGGTAITTPTLSFGNGTLTRTGGFLDSSGRILGDLEADRDRFTGGFTDFRRARLQEVENARARTTGNLRSQLGRRGILGASFAQDAITRTELEFQQQADKVAAEIDVQEFGFNLENLKVQQATNQAAVASQLTELGLSLDFISGINQAIVQRDQIAASLEIARLNRRSGGGSISGGGGITSFGGGTANFPSGSGVPATFGSGNPSFTTQFDQNFNIASTINPGTPSQGSFSESFLT